MEDKNLFLFVLATLVVVSFVTFSGTKDLTGRYDDQGSRGVLSCSDSDNGVNIFTKGYVETNTGGKIRRYNDRCGTGGDNIVEYFCRDNKKDFLERRCPNGMVCTNSKCELDRSSNYF